MRPYGTPAQATAVLECLYLQPRTGQEPVAVSAHRPADPAAARWCVIAPPFAEEHKYALRSLYEAGQLLAQRGYGAVCIEPRGCGNSPLDYRSVTAGQWSEDLLCVTAWLRSRWGVLRCALAGIRLGGLIAMDAARNNPAVDQVILIAPITSGGRYWQELQRKNRLRSAARTPAKCDSPSPACPIQDVQGYSVSPRLIESIRRLEGTQLCDDIHAPISLLTVGKAATSLAARLSPRMMGRVRDSVRIPCRKFWTLADPAAGARLAEGLVAVLSRPREPSPGESGLPDSRAPRQSSVYRSGRGSETRVTIDSHGSTLRGVLHEPLRRSRASVGVVFVNGGAGTSWGPHRVFVDGARQLAEMGLASLRFDSRGRGESGGAVCGHPKTFFQIGSITVEDIIACGEYLQAQLGVRELMLLGICAGGDLALVAAGSMRAVRHVIAWSPFDGYAQLRGSSAWRRLWHALLSYGGRLIRPVAWLRALRGEIDYRGCLASLRNQGAMCYAMKEHEELLRHPSLCRPRADYPGTFSRMPALSHVRRVLGVYSEHDPLGVPQIRGHYRTLCGRNGVAIDEATIADSGHGFYGVQVRSKLLALTMEWIGRQVTDSARKPAEHVNATDKDHVSQTDAAQY